MPLKLDDMPEIVNAASDLIEAITGTIDPGSPGGRSVTKAELIALVQQTLTFAQVVVEQVQD